MYADLEVTYGHPWVELYNRGIQINDADYGDGDGIVEAGETIEIHAEVWNRMAMAYHPYWGATADNADIAFTSNNVVFQPTALNPAFSQKSDNPIVFTVPGDFRSSNVHFDLTIVADTSYSIADHSYSVTFPLDLQVGATQILLVDDDGGADDEAGYADIFGRMRLPYDIWDKSDSGSPSAANLAPYETVFWMTGKPGAKGGVFTTADVSAMETFLSSAGDRNLVMAGFSAAEQLATLDADFVHNYLHVNYAGYENSSWFRGLASSPIGEGVRYTLDNSAGLPTDPDVAMLSAVNGGLEAFVATNEAGTNEYGVCGVTYTGAYNTVFLSFPLEFIDDEATADGFTRADDLVHRMLTFFGRGQTTGVDDPSELPLPNEFALEQNSPNPFNPSTIISYRIGPGQPEMTNLSIFNLLGQKVATLVNKVQGPGAYTVEWDGRAGGEELASGVYFYRLTRGDFTDSKKMVFVK